MVHCSSFSVDLLLELSLYEPISLLDCAALKNKDCLLVIFVSSVGWEGKKGGFGRKGMLNFQLSGMLCYTSYITHLFKNPQYNNNTKLNERLIYPGHTAEPEMNQVSPLYLLSQDLAWSGRAAKFLQIHRRCSVNTH